MSRVVGLDIGTSAVRAAEVGFGRGRPVLHRFGQVALPPGAVVAGEVIDPHAVSAAIRRLWREAGFTAKKVVTGVANQRVVARVAELPAMTDEELRSSLRFQVQDLIPIPIEEAVLDYQVVERRALPDSEEQLRVLLVAAHRDMLMSLLAAIEGAGLTASRIDLAPFALVRSLHQEPLLLVDHDQLDSDGPGDGGAEAIVSIGAGVTNVLVHEDGLPRFVRTLASGGGAVTDAVAEDLQLGLDAAEGLKRRADPLARNTAAARAGQVSATVLTPLLEEIRGSIDFYMAQSGGVALRRIVLTGAGSRMLDLQSRLSGLVGVPVVTGDPLATVDVGSTGLTDEVLASCADVLGVALGLALSGHEGDGSSRPISLLPVEIETRRRAHKQEVLAGLGVAGLAAALVVLVLLRNGRVSDAEQAAAQEQARTAALQARVSALSDVEAMEADLAERRGTVTTVLDGEVAWPRFLQEVATVLPNDVWLTSFNGTSGAAGAPSTVDVAGMGFDQTSAARWLVRVGELDSVTALWLPSSAKSEASNGRPLINFSSTATLTETADADRLDQFLGGRDPDDSDPGAGIPIADGGGQ